MTDRKHQQLLAVCTYSPGHCVKAREALDALLATAVFGQSLEVLFCGEGVWQLLANQGDYTGGDKPLSSSLAALPLYEIQAVYADAQSLQERGLSKCDLIPIAEVIDSSAATRLMAGCQRLLSF